MKARVKETGEIVEVINIDFDALVCTNGDYYTLEEIEGLECEPDYWTRLEHQYAGMAMQGMMSGDWVEMMYRTVSNDGEYRDLLTNMAQELAHALVEKMKEKK